MDHTLKLLPHVALLALINIADAGWAAQEETDGDPPQLSAVLLTDPAGVRLDGLLDEAAWQTADVMSGFRQREPSEGAEASERTEVRVLYDRNYLYIGVSAYDSEPEAIIARQLERDASLGLSRFGPSGGDDSIELILDTFRDRRNAYYYATNPLGVQVDGLITDESESPDLNWDPVWDVRSQITADGWSTEIVIPLRTLRYPAERGAQTWGFNVQRIIKRKNEQVLWTSWSRDNEGLHRVSRAGELTGLQSLQRKLEYSVKPYVLAEGGTDYADDPSGQTDVDGQLGLDAKLGFATGLVLDLTVNTDFAQVEADNQQIDLTRFNLFFPEKREFFLENAGIFEFGAPGFGGPPNFLLFFSRRIGLARTGFAEAEIVPMIAGARLTGRIGGQTVGLLNVLTGEEETLGVPLTNFSVARIKRDIGQQSYVGAMATYRVEDGGANNGSGGADWNFWLSEPLVFRGYYARTQGSELPSRDSWRVVLDYTGDWIGGIAEHMEIDPAFEPGIGFVRRDNIARSLFGFRLSPRPPIAGLRKIDIFNRFEYIVAADSREVRDRAWQISVTPQLDSGDRAQIEFGRLSQRLDESFELTPGVVVPEGDYEDWILTGSISTSRNRAFAAEVFGGVQGFWDGDLWRVGAALFYSSPHIGIELVYDHNDVEVPDGVFTTDLVGVRLNLAANTRLFGNALIQYNSQTGTFLTNLRVNFIHRPGSDLFVVFNDRRGVRGGRWDPESRALIVKLTYLKWF